MFNILGFNFLFDSYALNPYPTNIELLTSASVYNGIFDEINISSEVDASTIDTTIPIDFTKRDILLCDFNGNINGGSLGIIDYDLIKIKRRIYGTFDWITLFEIEVNNLSDTYFIKYDKYAKNNTTYEYAFVPATEGVEGNYSVVLVYSEFHKIYLCDAENMYSFDARVAFGTINQINKTSTFEPIIGKYPIVVSNAELNYKTGELTGTIVTPLEEQTKVWNLQENITLQKKIVDFLTNRSAKIYKDWMGNSYLIMVTDNVEIIPDNNLNGRLADVSFKFTEIGDTESQEDLYENGLISVPSL